MNQKYQAPEVYHLTQAVKAVKDGLLPERKTYVPPQKIDIEDEQEEEREDSEK